MRRWYSGQVGLGVGLFFIYKFLLIATIPNSVVKLQLQNKYQPVPARVRYMMVYVQCIVRFRIEVGYHFLILKIINT